ncbi:type IV secretion protein IcmD [Gammaproteobacteria bacterium]|nr:type IV secretion protein IcmD [Gammaproteobacteria bacterium]
MFRSLLIRTLPIVAVTSQVLAQEKATAGGGAAGGGAATGIGKVAGTVTGQLEAVGNLIVGIAQVAGLVFMMAGLFKLKQHKDNPQQIPIGTPLTMLVIGACLAFLPSLIETGGETIFGTEKKAGGFAGKGFKPV